jgi:hypothetical protein
VNHRFAKVWLIVESHLGSGSVEFEDQDLGITKVEITTAMVQLKYAFFKYSINQETFETTTRLKPYFLFKFKIFFVQIYLKQNYRF